MNIRNVFYIAGIAGFIAACSGEKAATDSAPAASVHPTQAVLHAPAGATVATVNGEVLTEPMLDVYAKGRGWDPADPAQRQRALDSLIENVLLAQDTFARGLAARPEVQAEVALVRLQQLAGRGLADLRGELKITEEQIKAHYDAEVARTGLVEVQVKHILFADEPIARAANERALKADADFDALIVEYGANGAKQARDLGWANLTQLPPELAAAVQPLPDGQVTPLPVQTSYGWHVAKRVASRPFTPPPFEQVKDGARKQLVDQALAQQVKALRDKAKIELPAAASATPAPAPTQGN